MKQHPLIIFMLLTLLTGFTDRVNAQRSSSRAVRGSHNTYLQVDEDSSVNPVQTLITYKDSQLFNFRTEGGKILELYVDNRKIPADSFSLYAPLLRRLEEQIRADKLQAEKDRIQAMKDEVQAKMDQVQAMKDEEQAKKDAEEAQRDAEQAKEDVEQAHHDADQAKKDAEQAALEGVQAQKDQVQAKIDAEQAVRDAEQAKRDAEQAKLDAIQAEKDRAVMKNLISDLVKENLIPDEKSLVTLMLNEFVFVINGKKQSEQLLEKFKTKYVSRPGYTISFHNDSR